MPEPSGSDDEAATHASDSGPDEERATAADAVTVADRTVSVADATVPEAVAERLDDEDLLATAAALVGIDTQNPPGETVAAVEYVADALAEVGVETERVAADPSKPNLLARLPGGRDVMDGSRATDERDAAGQDDASEGSDATAANDATLLLVGHLDTVPFDAAAWSRDPLGERDGDRLYGRGATDMKGAVAAMVSVVRAYAAADVAPPVDLTLALVGDEETAGEAGLSALLSSDAPAAVDALAADACVVGEPTCEDGRHSVCVADRGSIWLTLEAEGRAAHGSRPAIGVNAVERLWAALQAVEAALAERPLNLVPEVETIVEESVAFFAASMGEAAARATFEHPTVNLGRFSGGEAINTVPEHATAHLDVRLTASVYTPDVVAEVREVVAAHEGVEIADVSWSVGSYESPDSPVVDATVAAAESVCGERVYRRSATGGGDAKRLRSAGIPTVEFAFGPDNAHAVNEYTTVEALRRNAETYARLPAALVAAYDRQDG